MSAHTIVRGAAGANCPRWLRLGLVGVGLCVVVSTVPLEAQTTTRVSVATGGIQSAGSSWWFPSLSADGRYVAFGSDSDDLVAGDDNGRTDVFVHDRQAGTTTRVSVATGGAQGAGHSAEPSINADGRFVAFVSSATNLVGIDTNDRDDIFVRDRDTGTTTRVSVASNGTEAKGSSRGPVISGNGRYVSFLSPAANLVAGDTNDNWDVFVHDRQTSTTTRVNVTTGGLQSRGDDQDSWAPALSADGRLITFASWAPDLVTGDANDIVDVFVHDQQTGTTTRISAGASPSGGGGDIPSISGDGRFVVFSSSASDLVPGDTNTTLDVFVHDRLTGGTSRLGAPGWFAATNGDGRYVVFNSPDGDVVPDDSNGERDVFVRDRHTGVTARVSVGPSNTQVSGGSFFPSISADGLVVAFASSAPDLVDTDTNGVSDIFVHDLDVDGDGLPAPWETAFGLDPLSNTEDDGSGGDVDVDGRTNAQELADGTHPRGFYTRYLAEGATSSFFDTRLALLNPSGLTKVLFRFQKGDGTSAARVVALTGPARITVDPRTVAGLGAAEFSTIIESDGPVAVDRQMTWDATGYGSHAETALAAPSTTWYLAEGATHSNFSLFYLVQNPHATSVPVTVTYLLPAPAAPLTKVYTVPAKSRFNIWVNNEATSDPGLAGLGATDVSAVITAPQPILVERAMYLTQAGPDGLFGTPDDILFGAGHASAGVPAPALSWFMAEGATGPYFDEFILIANPGPSAADVEARYLLVDGTVVTKTYTVPPASRFNIWVNEEVFPGLGKALAEEALSATLTSTNGVPIIVERSMWWPRPSPTWMEAHNTPGTTATGTLWGLAEGEVGGPTAAETYILIANTSPFAGTARVTVVLEGGGIQTVYVPLPASSRTNVPVIESWFPGVTGKRFGALISSFVPRPSQINGDTPAQIVVERAMYSDADGIHWAAGTSATATRLQP